MVSFFDEIARNRTKTWILMAIFSLFFVFIISFLVWAFGLWDTGFGSFLIALGFGLVVIYALFTYYTGDKIVLAFSHAQPADEKQYPLLYSTVEGLAHATQIPMPKIYIIQDPNPNAFATGRHSKPSIAVTTGLLSTMDRNELQGVIAHEISHIQDNDIQFMTIAIAFAGIIGMISAFLRGMLLFGGLSGGGRRNEGGAILLLIGIVIGVLAPIVALLIRLAISRKREYMADANGARITRDPHSLASALRKISTYSVNPDSRSVKHANEVIASIYFANPFTAKSVMNIFSTHPPIEDRIARLEKMY